MKKYLSILITLCLCVSVNAQIQTKFWGLELSNWYSSLEAAKEIIADKCDYAYIEDNCIKANQGNFGGYEWKFITFDFYKGAMNYSLFDVNFSSNHQTYSSAKNKYDILLSSLTNKYGIPYTNDEDPEDVSHIWADDGEYRCMLEITRAESKGGEIYWYVTLDYYDLELLSLKVKKENDEL